jgi:hypothetical protein
VREIVPLGSVVLHSKVIQNISFVLNVERRSKLLHDFLNPFLIWTESDNIIRMKMHNISFVEDTGIVFDLNKAHLKELSY